MSRHHRRRRTEAVGSHGTPGRLAADRRGFTLLEILIALSTFLVVLFAVYTSFDSSQKTYAAGEQRADIQQPGTNPPNRLARVRVTVQWGGGRPQTVVLESMRAE